MGDARHRYLALAGVALAASGVTVIVLAVTARTPPLAESGSLISVVSPAEQDPPPPVESDTFRPPPAYPPPPRKIDDAIFLPRSEPAAIEIPEIGVYSEMQQVGLTAEHTLEVPAPGPHYDEAAWYKHSVTPGEIGPSVIVGHVDSAADGPSVFFDLGALRPRDEIRITRRDGTVAIFRVEAVRQYPKEDFPTDLVYGDTEHAALRLITCGGTFDRGERSYRDNIIVFAALVTPTRHATTPMTRW